MRETELFPPLKELLKKDGFKVYGEVPCFGRSIDVVAVKDKEIIAIEMKLNLSNTVLCQANLNSNWVNKSYVAVASMPRIESMNKCECFGLGIISIKENRAGIILHPKHNISSRKRFDFTGWKEATEAGMPCRTGVSEAFCVLDRIERYVKEHPEADWQEIYDNIVHHYASKASLRGTMQNWKGFYLDSYKQELKENNSDTTVERN